MDIQPLEASDLRFAQELREIAGWNQVDRDWLRLINYQPDGCFRLEVDGRAVATATTTIYDNQLAWIGMILVHPDYRRRGFASALLEHCLSFLVEEKGMGWVRLDATRPAK